MQTPTGVKSIDAIKTPDRVKLSSTKTRCPEPKPILRESRFIGLVAVGTTGARVCMQAGRQAGCLRHCCIWTASTCQGEAQQSLVAACMLDGCRL